jgi:hypothetical protein
MTIPRYIYSPEKYVNPIMVVLRNSPCWPDYEPAPWELLKRQWLSACMWLAFYYFMAIFGGSVAFHRFPRTYSETIMALPDIGFEFLEAGCPDYLGNPEVEGSGQNIQSWVLAYYYFILTPRSLFHKQGRVLMTRFFVLNCAMFVTRSTLVGITSLPNPNFNPNCVLAQQEDASFFISLVKVFITGFPPKACGDMIYSGHTACTMMSMAIFLKMDAFSTPDFKCFPKIVNRSISFLSNFIHVGSAFVALVSIVKCRSHYSIDIILALFFSYFLTSYYFLIADGVTPYRMFGTAIRYFEGHDLIEDAKAKSINGGVREGRDGKYEKWAGD